MESGYEPETGICWYFGNKGDNDSYNPNSHRHCRCPACTASHLYGEARQGQYETALFGRCRSGKRWFWSAQKFNEEAAHGWADTEEQAMTSVMGAVRSLKSTLFMKAIITHRTAQTRLKELNEAKRRQRPAPDTSDARITEYLYTRHGYKFRITKKTKKRVFYCREPLPIEESEYTGIRFLAYADEIGVVDRQKLEQEGEVYNMAHCWNDDFHLYRVPPSLREEEPLPDLRELKAAMAAAHPDRGGSSEAFIKARARYKAARRSDRSDKADPHLSHSA